MSEYFKVLNSDGRSTIQNHPWPLPENGEPGAWVEATGPLKLCRNGIHVTSWDGVWGNWITRNGVIYRAEIDRETIGDIEEGNLKIATRRARLLAPVALSETPQWWQDVQSFIATIPETPWMQRLGAPNESWMVFPTRAAAWDAAGDAAWAAARAAAWDAAWDAAGDAARDAAWNAARNAARNAAGDAAQDAAWNPARNAARNAAGNAAGNAARNAARNAAGNAARDTALLARCLIVADIIAPEHLAHVRARWDVWQRGYGLLCDVDGVLYIYESIN